MLQVLALLHVFISGSLIYESLIYVIFMLLRCSSENVDQVFYYFRFCLL